MSTQRVFQIERFFFGNLIRDGQAIGKPTIIARSPQLSAEIAQQALKLARVKPPDAALTTADMPSTLALFRGGQLGFILVKSQRTAEGFPQLMYLIIPELAMRWLGGNYNLFESLGYQEMRTFETLRGDLHPLTLDDPQTLSDEEQINYLYDFYQYCGDNTKNMEGLLSALILQQGIAVHNAPQNLQKRLGFIQGLLSLLPAPARVGMTWATHSDPTANTPTQINFVASLDGFEDSLVYDWKTGKLAGEAPKDKYSKFIVSQLRLDASLVVDATTNIARTAVWRAMRKESLPQALHFASRRAAIDSAVANNQPADRETVSDILRQDPTLTDELRGQYARHLLAMTLSLADELDHADVLPVVAAADRQVAEQLYNQMKEAAEDPKNALIVLDLAEHWLVNIPQAAVIPWQQLAYLAAKTHLEAQLAQGKTKKAIEFLTRVQHVNRALRMESIVPELVQISRATASYDSDLALALFLLAAEYLPLETFHPLVCDPQFIAQLPRSLYHALLYLQPQAQANPPKDLLVAISNDLEAQHRMLTIGRLAELAVSLKREDLIDSQILEGLLRAVHSGYAWRFGSLIQYLAAKYTRPDRLQELERGAMLMLPHLYFSMGQYEHGVQLLELVQNQYYAANRMSAYTDFVGDVFLNNTLSLDALRNIFTIIERSKIRPEPRTRAYTAVLTTAEWGQAYRPLARRLTIMIYNDPKLIEVMGLDHVLQMLAFHIQSRDEVSIKETGDVLLAIALRQGKRGVELIQRMWIFYAKHAELQDMGINLVRQYVRLADSQFVTDLPDYFDKKLAKGLGSILRATYALRRLMSGRNLLEFNEALRLSTSLLVDISTAYQEGKDIPPAHRLRTGLDPMSGGLEPHEREAIGDNLVRIAKAVFTLGKEQNRGKETADYERALLRNEALPQTALDFLILLGGIFSSRRRFEVDLKRESMTHALGNRSATMLRDEVAIIATFLEDLLAAFPPNHPPKFDLDSLNAEIDNLWQQLSLYNQRQVRDSLATQTQYLAQVVALITRRNKEAVFKNTKLTTGQAVPSNEMEAMLWISGYFKRTHST